MTCSNPALGYILIGLGLSQLSMVALLIVWQKRDWVARSQRSVWQRALRVAQDRGPRR
jgi:phosphoenolpyruvate-protein kinase (PTS system EI component)